HKYVSKAVNASYGRWENLWSSEKTSVILLESEEDVLDKIRYIVCNPVEAGLVANPDNWPGSLMYKPGQSKIVKRPEIYFKDDGVMPKSSTLTIETPPVLKKIRQSLLVKELTNRINTAISNIKDAMRREGRRFMGVAEVLKQKCSASPRTQASHRNMNSRVACKNKWGRIEAIARNKVFLAEYYKALAIWKETKDPQTVFPAGTYAMRIYNGVNCSPG
ncbi:MAG: hypothetical protein JXR91_14070, partial [Deltaproteobacteria bacterium]|nr:hypothetical protein [Deltaproteobacteria bacterium]